MTVELTSNRQSIGVFEITAYTWTGNKTFCDQFVEYDLYPTEGRTIAADVSIYPCFTELEINGQTYVVEDSGGAIKGNIIDLYIGHSDEEALTYGRQNHEVFLSD